VSYAIVGENTVVKAGSTISRGSVLSSNVVVGAHVTIAPFTRVGSCKHPDEEVPPTPPSLSRRCVTSSRCPIGERGRRRRRSRSQGGQPRQLRHRHSRRRGGGLRVEVWSRGCVISPLASPHHTQLAMSSVSRTLRRTTSTMLTPPTFCP
jgi:hypothetical protein